jgi:hypothetical protein
MSFCSRSETLIMFSVAIVVPCVESTFPNCVLKVTLQLLPCSLTSRNSWFNVGILFFLFMRFRACVPDSYIADS